MEQLPSQSLLSRCAQSWGLRNLFFIRKMENIVYQCQSDAGSVYLRLTTPLRRARPEIEAEIHWIEHLAKFGLKVPQIIPDRKGNKIASFVEGEQQFEAVVFSAIDGQHPSEKIVTSPDFLKTLGSLVAKMHLASQFYEGAHQNAKREEWFEERGLRHAMKAAKNSKEVMLQSKLKESIAWLDQLPHTPETYGLIHADLGAQNMFIGEDDSISIIDFDDSCYHFFVFDLAIVVYTMAGRFKHRTEQPEEAKWLSHLVKGYRTVRPLSQEEIDIVPKLIDFACLRLYFWIECHETLRTFHEDAIEKVIQHKQWAKNRLCTQTT